MCGISLRVCQGDSSTSEEEKHDLLQRRGPDQHGTKSVRDSYHHEFKIGICDLGYKWLFET